MLFLSPVNIVLHKPAYQSSTDAHNIPSQASNANDGDFRTRWNVDRTCSHTNNNPQAWWAVDLLRNYTLAYVTLTNRNTHGMLLPDICHAMYSIYQRCLFFSKSINLVYKTVRINLYIDQIQITYVRYLSYLDHLLSHDNIYLCKIFF